MNSNLTTTSNQHDKPSQIQQLMTLLNQVDVFHNEDEHAYVSYQQASHTKHIAIDNPKFQHWLAHQYFKQYQQAPTAHSLQTALNTLKGQALYNSTCHTVYTRIAQDKDNIYINLADDLGQSIVVNAQGWEIVQEVPVKFYRSPMMRALPQPVNGGSLQTLWSFVNVPDEQDRKLLLVWLLECFRSNTPFPVLLLQGEQGSAKSTTQQRLRTLIDPSRVDLRAAPHKIEDIFISTANNWCVSYNNLSHLSTKEQDAFCILATGGGYATRQLFTNTEEIIIEIKRPVMLNGISHLASAQDFIDRCIILECPPIENNARKTEAELHTAFTQIYPQLFGAVLDTLAATLKALPTVTLTQRPRMADFALLGLATETALGWPSGSFMQAYETKQEQAILSGLGSSPVSQALLSYLAAHGHYGGTFVNLLQALIPYQPAQCSHWPKSAKGLADVLKRQSSALRILGVQAQVDTQRHTDGYHVNITKNSTL